MARWPYDPVLTADSGASLVDRAPGKVDSRQFVDAAAPHAVFVNDRQAIYDPASHRTYVAYNGLERDVYITYLDHQAGVLATPVLVGAYTLAADNDHGVPSIVLDLDGHIHLVWGSHNSAHRHSKSDSPYDISAWTTQALSTEGTYPSINCDPATGDLYIIDRTGTAGSTGSPTFPSQRFGGMRKSTDGGATWSAVAQIVDSGADRFYPYGTMFAADGLMHLSWTVDTSDTRANIHHAKYNPVTDTWHTADGTNLGSQISSSEQNTDCLVATRTPIGVATLAVAKDGRIAVGYSAGTLSMYVSVWDGSSWAEVEFTDNAPTFLQGWPTIWPVDGAWRAAASVENATSGLGDVVIFGGDGSAWTEIGTILEGASGEGYTKISPVRGDGPGVAITMEDADSFAATSATANDLLPIHLISDQLAGADDSDFVLRDGSRSFTGTIEGVTPTMVAHLATKGYVDSEIAGALGSDGTHRLVVLVDDGGSGVEPLTDDDGLWLYGAYPGTEH